MAPKMARYNFAVSLSMGNATSKKYQVITAL
jgi:hypothetical protein